jgi:hypothetical protein
MTPLRLLAVAIVATALLTGCTMPAADPQPTSAESGPACATGLAEALQAEIAAQYEANADLVAVREDATAKFAPAEVDSLIGCRLVVSTPAEGSDGTGTQVQLVGIVHDDVTDTLLALGWTQPFPDTEPFAFQAPEGAPGLAVYDLSDSEWNPLDFDQWGDFVDGGFVVIGAPGF